MDHLDDTPPSFLAEHWEARAARAEAEAASLKKVLWRAKVLLWRKQEQSATRVEHQAALDGLRKTIDEHEQLFDLSNRGRMEEALAWAASTDEEKPR